MNNQISITAALRELKTIDDRIKTKINQTVFVYATKTDENIPGFKKEEDFVENAKSILQSVKDLMVRRKKIKNAIVISNATTVIEIPGVGEMKVAEAIERKNFIKLEKQLLSKLANDYAKAETKIENNNTRAQERLEREIEKFISKDGKTDIQLIERYTENFWNREKTSLIDPVESLDVIKEMDEELIAFEEQVDIKLAENNARTIITID